MSPSTAALDDSENAEGLAGLAAALRGWHASKGGADSQETLGWLPQLRALVQAGVPKVRPVKLYCIPWSCALVLCPDPDPNFHACGLCCKGGSIAENIQQRKERNIESTLSKREKGSVLVTDSIQPAF